MYVTRELIDAVAEYVKELIIVGVATDDAEVKSLRAKLEADTPRARYLKERLYEMSRKRT